MYWWITDKGLIMTRIASDSEISAFDLFAGQLADQHFQDGRLHKDFLLTIAKALDQREFTLKDHLQPGRWKKIAIFNDEHPKAAIKSFEKAAQHAQFTQGVRRRLYVARDRFQDLMRIHSPICESKFCPRCCADKSLFC